MSDLKTNKISPVSGDYVEVPVRASDVRDEGRDRGVQEVLDDLQLSDVSQLVGKVGAVDGQKVTVASYHQGWATVASNPVGGGDFVWQSDRDKSDHNGGTVISPTVPWDGSTGSSHTDFLNGVGETDPAGLGCWVRQYDDLLVVDFGGDPSGSTLSHEAIQATLDAQVDLQVTTTGAGSSRGYSKRVKFGRGAYVIGTGLNNRSAYALIEGEDCVISPDPSFVGGTAFTAGGNAWRIEIEGIQFQDFNIALDLDSANVNSGRVTLKRLGFFGNTTAINYDCQSSTGLIENCIFRENQHELNIISGDVVTLRGGWIQRGLLVDDYDGGIIVQGGALRMENLVCTPSVQTVLEPCWIKNYSTVICNDVRFGGEPGQHCVVNNYSLGTAVTGDPKDGVLISGSDTYFGADPMVRLFEIPNSIYVEVNRGLTGSGATIVDWSSSVSGGDQTTKVNALGTTVQRHSINLIGNVLPYGTGNTGVPDNLLFITDKPNDRLLASTGSDVSHIRFDLRDVSIAPGDIYGDVQWIGRDASGNGSGIRATIRTEATGTAGGVKTVIANKPNASGLLKDVFEVHGDKALLLEPVILPTYTVGALPSGELGMKAFVSDSTSTTFRAVVAGGGSDTVPVFYDGTDWRIG